MGNGLNQFNLIQMSAIQEMANIGLGNAVTALSTLTNAPFNITVPSVETVALADLTDRLDAGAGLCVAVLTSIDGDVGGYNAFIFPWQGAQKLWTLLLGQCPESPEEIDEMYGSTILEVGNILTSSFLNALSEMSGLALHVSPPQVGVDDAATLVSSIVVEAEMGDMVALAVETQILGPSVDECSGFFVCIPTLDGLNRLFAQLGISEAA